MAGAWLRRWWRGEAVNTCSDATSDGQICCGCSCILPSLHSSILASWRPPLFIPLIPKLGISWNCRLNYVQRLESTFTNLRAVWLSVGWGTFRSWFQRCAAVCQPVSGWHTHPLIRQLSHPTTSSAPPPVHHSVHHPLGHCEGPDERHLTLFALRICIVVSWRCSLLAWLGSPSYSLPFLAVLCCCRERKYLYFKYFNEIIFIENGWTLLASIDCFSRSVLVGHIMA